MAGILDSARMSHFIFEKLGYGQGQIDASVMGGHGMIWFLLLIFLPLQG